MKKYLLLILGLAIAATFALPVTSAQAAPKFRRPVDNLLSPVYSALYDDQAGSGVKNYWCSSSTVYNNHTGTDFRENVGTHIYNSANGNLYYRYDSCPTYGYIGSSCGGGYGNHARIDHEGNVFDGVGWVTIYAHMQATTVGPLGWRDCSAYIGKTGSSGSSSGPHLHFEVRKYSYPNNDPFKGACGGPTSFWVNQGSGYPSVPTTQCQ